MPILQQIIRAAKLQGWTPANDPPGWLGESSGWSTPSGVVINPENAIKFIAVYAAIGILQDTIASLPLQLRRRRQERGSDPARDHALYNILHDLPNPEMTSFELRETLIGYLGKWGNSYCEIAWTRGGQVGALWPLRPDRMGVGRVNGRLVYQYHLPKPIDGKTHKIFDSSLIWHIKHRAKNGLVGISPIGVGRTAIGAGVAAEEYGARFFEGSARPGIALEVPDELSDTAYERLKGDFETRHMGLKNAHRVAILEDGTKLTDFGFPPKDAQFIESRKFSVIEICRLFNMPPHKLAEMDAATFGNIEHQDIEFGKHTIRPWVVRIEQSIRRDLLLPSERERLYAYFNMSGLLRGDYASRQEGYATGRQWGYYSANDVRELEDQNPIEGGDTYMVPLNMVPADFSFQPASPAAPAGRADLFWLNNRDPDGTWRRLFTGRLADLTPGAQRSLVGRRRLQDSYYGIIEDAAGRTVRREANDVAQAAKKFLGSRTLGDFLRWLEEFYGQDHPAFIRRQLQPAITSYGESLAVEAGEEINVSGDLPAEIINFIDAYVRTAGARHSARHEGRLRDLATGAAEDGADPLPVVLDQLDAWRESMPAEMALEESTRAGAAIVKAFWGYHGVSKLRWNKIGESCPYCTGLDGAIVAINQFFLGAGQDYQPDGADRPLTPSYNIGHPPAHQGCDCMVSAA